MELITKKSSSEISKRIKEGNYLKFSGSWSFYQIENHRMILKFPNGFPERSIIVEMFKKLGSESEDDELWDCFCATMFWGGIKSDNFNKYEKQKEKIIKNLKNCILIDKPNLKEYYDNFNGQNSIEYLGIAFYSKLLFFIGQRSFNSPMVTFPIIF
jgi:hypothetical protein